VQAEIDFFSSSVIGITVTVRQPMLFRSRLAARLPAVSIGGKSRAREGPAKSFPPRSRPRQWRGLFCGHPLLSDALSVGDQGGAWSPAL